MGNTHSYVSFWMLMCEVCFRRITRSRRFMFLFELEAKRSLASQNESTATLKFLKLAPWHWFQEETFLKISITSIYWCCVCVAVAHREVTTPLQKNPPPPRSSSVSVFNSTGRWRGIMNHPKEKQGVFPSSKRSEPFIYLCILREGLFLTSLGIVMWCVSVM